MNFYPLKFRPIYKEKIWGGQKIKTHFKRNIPSTKIGESWEIAAHQNGTSTVINGPLAGKNLNSLIKKWPTKMTGTKEIKRFPLLIKLLDASRKLSVQVHPDEKYAQLNRDAESKAEMWYIIAAKPGAKLIYGFKKGCNYKDIKNAINNGTLEKYLKRVPVHSGDIFFIQSGTVHGIEEGILLAEIQQSSDTTYRLYDWNRTNNKGEKRDLHIDRALNAMNFNYNINNNILKKPLTYQTKNYTCHYLAACQYFITKKIDIESKYFLNKDDNKFYILVNLKGEGNLHHNQEKYSLLPGQTYYLPASINNIKITGKSEVLIIYLPDNKKNFIKNLETEGFNKKEIHKIAGINIWNNKL